MKTTLRLAAAAALLSLLPFSAEAFPVAPAPAVSNDAGLTLVAGGCGPGFHRGPFGGCRRNRFIRRPIIVRPLIRRPICRTILLPLPRTVCR